MDAFKWFLRFLETRRWARRFFVFIVIFAIWLGIAKEVGFVLFIIEESLQTQMFALWQARGSAKEFVLSAYRKTLDFGWFFLYAVGWMNPFAFVSFRTYFESAEVFYWAASSSAAAPSP